MTVVLPDEVIEILSRFHQKGFEAYAVGGCIRDLLLGESPKDWDITTSALPEETISVFSGEKTIPTGIAHGTVTLIWKDVPYEITTFRTDGTYSDHRRPDSVSFARSLEEDIARRDFTVNGLAAGADGTVIDFFGGVDDLKKKTIRAIGDPHRRFSEDALRILRALRFSSSLSFSIEPATEKALFDCTSLLTYVAKERVFAELKKLLLGDNVKDVLLRYPSILGFLIPELKPSFSFPQHTPYHLYDVYTHTAYAVEAGEKNAVIRLALLLHDTGKPACFAPDKNGVAHFPGHPAESAKMAKRALWRLKADHKTLSKVSLLIENHDASIRPEKTSVKRWLSKLGAEDFFSLLAVKRADQLAKNNQSSKRGEELRKIEAIAKEVLSSNDCLSVKELAVKGEDLKALGFSGKEIGDTLSYLLDLVLSGEKNEKDLLLEKAKKQRR